MQIMKQLIWLLKGAHEANVQAKEVHELIIGLMVPARTQRLTQSNSRNSH